MRLLRISLVALVAMTITTGCSATRNRFGLSRERDRDAVAPDEHEYSPRAGEPSDDEFRNPSGEPVPAPPAMGISRVKSVSFLRDISDKLHGRKDNCATDCVDDSELVGKCSPVEPCVPSDEHNKRVHRYVDRYYSNENTTRLNPLRSFRKAISKPFQGPSPAECSSECTEIQHEPGCNAPQKVCDQSRRPHRVHSDANRMDAHEPGLQPSVTRPKRSGDGLAEPLEEHEIHDAPGLITPNEQIRVEDLPALPVPGQAVPEVPAVPVTPVPTNPPVKPPIPVPQVEELPMPPAQPPGTTRSVEPPVWPRLQGPNKQVSMPSSAPVRSASSGPMIIQPRPNR